VKNLILLFFAAALTFGQPARNEYIIELASPASAGGAAERVRGALEREGIEILDQYDTVLHGLAVRAADPQRLISMPGVAAVYPARVFRRHLDRVAVLHNLANAWSGVGPDRAGAGIKIGIIDSGIDLTHPALRDETLTLPEGYPKTTREEDKAWTNTKVIVARAYGGTPEAPPTPQDPDGHGTMVAAIAAGAPVAGPYGRTSGVAPRAWIGVYKVFKDGGTTSEAHILRAIEDAVKDGMNVINMSLGTVFARDVAVDPVVKAVQRATELGVTVVVSAGNDGPGLNTISSPATAPSAIAAGSNSSDRALASSLALATGLTVRAVPGSRSGSLDAIAGDLVSIKPWDFTELGCSTLPPGAFKGRIVLILRGDCLFEVKLQKAAEAGALAAIVYTDAARPDAIAMAVGDAGLPAAMVSHQDGLALKAALESGPVRATIQFKPAPIPADPNQVSSFSARGPGADLSLKPEVLATGNPVLAPSIKGTWEAASGTSFSAPVLAGAAALVRSARPGLLPAQYKSLLVNSARKLTLADGKPAPVHHAGAGVLDAAAALRSTASLAPAALSFGVFSAGGTLRRELAVTSIAGTSTAYTAVVEPMPGQGAEPPEVAPAAFTVPAGGAVTLSVGWSNPPWRNQSGWIRLRPSAGGAELRIPYWMSLAPGQSADIVVLDAPPQGLAGYADWVLFRPVDPDGVATPHIYPYVEVLSGGGRVIRVEPADSAARGAFIVWFVYGPSAGENVLSLRSGQARRDISIRVP
jgi:subtilisin family serine protease